MNQCQALLKKISKAKRNIINKNVLFFTSYALLYADFMNICQRGYTNCAKKYIKLFPIIL